MNFSEFREIFIFSMDGGKLTIKDHGLFLIYAQVKI